VLIAGDSHAMSLASAAVMGEVKLDTLLLAAHTCLPFTGYTVGAGPVADEACQQMTALALDLAGRLASLRTVVLATRGPYYFSGAGFGAEGPNQNRLAPRSDPAARIPQDKAFVDGWVAAIASLLRTGKRVVFAIDAPELGVDPRDCLPRPLSAGAALRNCVVPRALVDERQRRYRALVGQIAARSPGLLVYDPTSLFCSSEACYGVRDGRLLYFDRDHPSVAASALVLEDLRSWLERQPRPAAP
jgi:hypothetical protein